MIVCKHCVIKGRHEDRHSVTTDISCSHNQPINVGVAADIYVVEIKLLGKITAPVLPQRGTFDKYRSEVWKQSKRMKQTVGEWVLLSQSRDTLR